MLLERLAQIEDAALDSLPLLLSESHHATAARHHRRASAAGEIYRHAAAARQPQRARAHEARIEWRRFLKLLERMRATIPGVSIRTSFIVGFPGETEADFRELCDFVRAAEFDWMGVFSYSDEDAAKSYALRKKSGREDDRAPPQYADGHPEENFGAQTARRIGQNAQAMLEGPSKDTDLVWEARHEAWRRKSTARCTSRNSRA